MAAAAAAIFLTGCGKSSNKSASNEITMETLLDEMVSRDIVTYFPEADYTQKQVSSYDRRSVSPDQEGWFANVDGGGYERLDKVDGRLEKVMFDCEGPGVVTRIWMTTKEKFGTMRFYFDGAEEPQLVIPAYDMKRFPVEIPKGLSLTHTHYVDDMAGVGGNSFFLPIPYQKSLKITFEEPDINVFIPRYYHVNYRTYPEGTKVRTWTEEETIALQDKIAEVSEALLNPADCLDGEQTETRANVLPGEKTGVEIKGSGALRHLEIKISGFDEEDYGDIMRAIRVKGSFDGVECIDAPLADFSGTGMGAPAIDSWYLYSNGQGHVISRWVMPYKESAEIMLVNGYDKPVDMEVKTVAGTYDWDENSLYFHCSHRFEKSIPLNNNYDTNANLDWNFTTIEGRGVYVGDLLSLYNYAIDWYGEGDEKIWVDDDTFPSHFGTGTEDYFNCSWAPVVVFLTPYGGAPCSENPATSHGYNAFMRTRNLDIIPFKTKFRYDIEMLSWNLGTADYYTTSYWYGDLTTTANK